MIYGHFNFGGVAIALSRGLKFSANERKSLVATTVFANVGNMGLPFVLFALGEAGLERAVVYLVGSSLLIATVFPIVLKGEGIKAGANVTLRLPHSGKRQQAFATRSPRLRPGSRRERPVYFGKSGG